MELREQSLEQARKLFQTHMQRDFPQSELKAWPVTEDMYRRGIYDMLEAWDKDAFVGYVWVVKTGLHAALIDYLAVLPQYRGAGVGGEILKALRLRYGVQGKTLLLESEYPEEAPEPETARRRLGFYARAGFQNTGVQVRLFGVRFYILSGDFCEDVRKAMEGLYHIMFSDATYNNAVKFI